MKRIGIAALLLTVLLCLVFPLASANEEPVVITPYLDGPEYHVAAGSDVMIRAGWGACTRGLAEAFRHSALVSMQVQQDGAPYLTVAPPARDYWSDPQPIDGNYATCVVQTRNGWFTEWLYSLGTLETGTYDLHFHWYLEHPLPDGSDHDGDGRIDVSVFSNASDITIIVE